MSASLVGSEMCIRDSRGGRRQTDMGADGHTHMHSKARRRTQTHADARAVSYTHLTLPTICSV
eukprot:9306772-Alexandrium_andersonii.AAC.1